MTNDYQFDLIIQDALEHRAPELLRGLDHDAHLWIRAQIWQESRFNPLAKSPAGARGLMQLMPATAFELGVENIVDPVENIFAGVTYLGKQWGRLSEIPDPFERMRFALASYNGGRGYVNMAMVIAREAEGLAGSYYGWIEDGHPAGNFQRWDYSSRFLYDPRCIVHGRHPDHQQMTDYVALIEKRTDYYRGLN